MKPLALLPRIHGKHPGFATPKLQSLQMPLQLTELRLQSIRQGLRLREAESLAAFSHTESWNLSYGRAKLTFGYLSRLQPTEGAGNGSPEWGQICSPLQAWQSEILPISSFVVNLASGPRRGD